VNPEAHTLQVWRGECLLGNGNGRAQRQKRKKSDVQMWGVNNSAEEKEG